MSTAEFMLQAARGLAASGQAISVRDGLEITVHSLQMISHRAHVRACDELELAYNEAMRLALASNRGPETHGTP